MIRVGPFPRNKLDVHIESFTGGTIDFGKEFDFSVSGYVNGSMDEKQYRSNIKIQSNTEDQNKDSRPKAEIDLDMERESAVELASSILIHCGTKKDVEKLRSRVRDKPPIERFNEEEEQQSNGDQK